jgi:hypothetical protein
MDYKLLEPTILEQAGIKSPSFNSSNFSLFSSTSFLYTLFFVVIIVAASFRYAYAGILRMSASESGIKESKEEFKRVTYGLLGVLSLWLILATFNRDMLTGDVGLGGLRTSGYSGAGSHSPSIVSTQTNGSGVSSQCDSPSNIKALLTSTGSGICANTSCSLMGCMNNTQYLPLIKSITGNDWKMALVIMCKESGGNKDAQNKNPNGSYDCGLMQINQAGQCDTSILDPQTNITKGVAKLREKINLSSNSIIYPTLKVRPETAVFTSYNCCANGNIPNSESTSCKTSDGWPSIPKWACPIDPGTGKYNMCGVKSYACDLTACLNSL